MATRPTFTLEESLAKQARDLGVNISAAARQVAAAVRAALAENDCVAYERHPEEPDPFCRSRGLERCMNGSEVWLAQVRRKRRPVLVLTRDEVLDVRSLVAVAEITTTKRGLAAEVTIDPEPAGLDHALAINCDGPRCRQLRTWLPTQFRRSKKRPDQLVQWS